MAGFYWMRGVREIPQEAFAAIVNAGGRQPADVPGTAGSTQPTGDDEPTLAPAAPAYSRDTERQRQVEEYAVVVATTAMTELFPGQMVREQPRNNPGFDLLVGDGLHYCEVKGTRAGAPQFLMSEGERAFGEARPDTYTLAVVYDIDLLAGTHRLQLHHGAPSAGAALHVAQWAGRLYPQTAEPVSSSLQATQLEELRRTSALRQARASVSRPLAGVGPDRPTSRSAAAGAPTVGAAHRR